MQTSRVRWGQSPLHASLLRVSCTRALGTVPFARVRVSHLHALLDRGGDLDLFIEIPEINSHRQYCISALSADSCCLCM
jgi:hypothetical protein